VTTSGTTILLNGFRMELSSPAVTVYVDDMPDNTVLRALRKQLGETCFVYWHDGKVYGLPQDNGSLPPFGTAVEIQCDDHLRFIAARIADILPKKFPQYKAFRRRPFTFLGQKEEIVEVIRGKMAGLPALVAQFKIRPKFELDAKLVELRDGDTFIGLFVKVQTRWEILASLEDLVGADIDLRGLCVVRRDPEEGQRRLVGTVDAIAGGHVTLSESYDELTSIPSVDVWLEGSKAAFARCLKTILGARYQAFEEERQAQEANLFTGPALESVLARMAGFLRKASPMQLGAGLACSVTTAVEVANSADYQSVVASTSVEYCFDPAKTKRHQYPWKGIETYGPFSRDTFARKSPRILVVFPDTVQGLVENFLRVLRDGVHLSGGSRYSAGFARTFGLVNPQFDLCRVPLLGHSGGSIGQLYRRAVEDVLASERPAPDVAITVILDEHAQLSDVDSPYLQAKAVLLMAGIAVQEVRTSTIAKQSASLQYILQNIGIALYAKMNGTPWTVDHDLTINDELIIGVGTCELSGSRFEQRQRYVGITTVFRGDGNYLLGNLSRECSYDDYPDVLRATTLDILREIKERNGWLQGDTVRIVFHAARPLRRVDVAAIIADCVDTLRSELNVEFAFLTVSHDHPFAALDLAQPGVPAGYKSKTLKAVYAPQRGTIIQLGRYTKLLCTNGPFLVKRENAPLPLPLLIHLHPQSTFKDLSYLTEQVLKFTALSWRSTLPASDPVTIYYSELIASLLARLRGVPDWSPAMLNVKLRASRWFL